LQSIIYDTNDDNASIYNITLAWREIAEIWEEFNLNPEIVYCDEEEVFKFLKILRDLHFIIQQEPLDGTNHYTHVEPVELTESGNPGFDIHSRNDEDRVQPSDRSKISGVFSIPTWAGEENNKFENNVKEENEYYYADDNEINDIREIEEELKQNLMNSNSNFGNPTLEEPSPAKVLDWGIYHSNIINQNNQAPLLPRINQMSTSNSNPVIRIAASTTSTNYMNEPRVRDSYYNPTPKHFKFAINDQISMFSSQDKKVSQTHRLNTSDIVEYARDPSTYRPYNNNTDTLNRDTIPLSQDVITTRTENQLQNFHSFNPDLSKDEVMSVRNNDSKTTMLPHTRKFNISDEGFSFDKANLFSIENLYDKENKGIKNPQKNQNMPARKENLRK